MKTIGRLEDGNRMVSVSSEEHHCLLLIETAVLGRHYVSSDALALDLQDILGSLARVCLNQNDLQKAVAEVGKAIAKTEVQPVLTSGTSYGCIPSAADGTAVNAGRCDQSVSQKSNPFER